MPDTKKQHTVPQFYLRAFASAKEKLFVYDKVQGRSFEAAVNDVAQKRRFYDIPRESVGIDRDSGYDAQVVEHTLAEREGVLSKALGEFLRNSVNRDGIDQEHRFALSYFMALQMLRTPFMRTKMNEMEGRAFEHLASTEGPDTVAPGTPLYTQIHVDEGDLSLLQARIMLNPMMSAQMMAPLIERIWCVGVNKTGHPLYTSDNPVVKYAHVDPPPGMVFGIGSEGVEVALPLTPEIVLMLWDGKAFPQMARFEGKRMMLTDDDITYYNWLQVSASERQVFSSMHDFALAEKICQERPHLRDPKRQQVWVD